MNSAHPIKDKAGAPDTGATIVALGSMPERQNTVCAEVLARLLWGESLTGMEAVFAASTTRLAAHIGYLEAEYGWSIDRREKVHNCTDGRSVRITVYSLDPGAIARAAKQGASSWCHGVFDAREALRGGTKKRTKAARRASTHSVAPTVENTSGVVQ